MNVAVLPIDREEIIDKLYTACRTCYNGGSPIESYILLAEHVTMAVHLLKCLKI